MSWLGLTEQLLQPLAGRLVALEPALLHAELHERALRLAGALQARGVRRVALYLEDAGELAIALLATVFNPETSGVHWIILAMAIGGAIGVRLALKVEMTEMPELVAVLHSAKSRPSRRSKSPRR